MLEINSRETPVAADAPKRCVDRLPKIGTALFHDNTGSFSEIARLGEGPADEAAAIERFRAVEPEGDCHAIAEGEVNLAAPRCLQRSFDGGITANLHGREQGVQECLVARAAHDANRLAGQRREFDGLRPAILHSDKSRRHTIDGEGHLEALTQLGINAMRGDHRIALVAFERGKEQVPTA